MTDENSEAEAVTPSIKKTRFTCPSCSQVTDQVWLNAYASPVNNPAGVPLRIEGEGLQQLSKNPQFPPEVREQKVDYWTKVNEGAVFLDRWAPVQTDLFVAGLEVSVCKECMGSAIWMGGNMVHPPQGN
jgi:hypothetical protein